ncbi:MAG: 3-deoxy-7-phosphoheptulonate synthase [Firmicutes bacterium]|nr:3-deoxy-7-phosphoheptulonate synthase [Bacillota bacterium]
MKPYSLVSREQHQENTIIKLGQQEIGGTDLVVMAGPCAVENREEYLLLAQRLKELGVHVLRGGAYKPRTSPYSFAGLGRQGLAILAEAREMTGLPVVTEVLDVRELEWVVAAADIVQIGSRNMQNYSLLHEVGQVDKPVLLKRGFSATIEEWLLAAEHIVAAGNPKVILCERGIRTFETYTRNTVDISAIPAVKQLSHLPIIVDPSHATGRWNLVAPVARAAIAAGADGLLVEVHVNPACALSDGFQSLTPENFAELMAELAPLARVMGRRLIR